MRAEAAKPVVCSVGSTDPTGGAGLFVDAGVYARMGVAAAFVVAGVTAQNSKSVSSVSALPPRTIAAQLDAIWSQVRPAAVRIGLVPDERSAAAVARFFERLKRRPPIVVDPVIAATSGHRFVRRGAMRGLRRLLSIADVVTPNAREAAELSDMPVRTVDDAARAALVVAKMGCAVLVTGGHLRGGGRVVDVLARGVHVTRYSAPRIGRGARGTGCLLAAALAASLARGDSLDRAVRRARSFVRRAIASARPLGDGRPQFAGVRRPPV